MKAVAMVRRIRTGCGVGLLTILAGVFAGVRHSYAGAQAGLYPGTHLLPSLLKVSGSVLLVLGLILGVAFLVRRFPLSRLTRRGAPGNIAVLDRFFLNPKIGLYLVRVGPRFLLLGVGGADVRLITELSEQEVGAPPESEIPPFSEQLEKFLSGLVSRNREKVVTGG